MMEQQGTGMDSARGVEHQEQQGKNETETVVFDGVLGFAFSLGNAIIMFLGSAFFSDGLTSFCIMSCSMALAIAICLKLVQVFSDSVQTNTGRLSVIVVYCISMIGSAVLGFLQISEAATVVAAVCFVCTLVMYAGFLGSLPRMALMIVVDALLIYVGAMFLLFTQIVQPYVYIIHAIAIVISLVFSFAFLHRDIVFREVISAGDSKRNSITVKGNNQTLFLVGFMLSAALAAFFIADNVYEAVITVGCAIGLGGLFSVLMHSAEERAYKEVLKKIMALNACLLLPIPLLPHFGQLVLLGCYLFIVSLNVAIIANAVVESARFNLVSPVWQFGKEGSVFFIGATVGVLLYAVAGLLSFDYGMNALCVGFIATVFVCSYIQIGVNYQVYPFEPVIDDAPDQDVVEEVNQAGKRKALWHAKIDVAVKQYHLSPREVEVLNILLKGRDTKYIMDKFCISQSTAKTHIYNIYRKFDIHSRQELIDFIEEMEIPKESASDQVLGVGLENMAAS